MAEEISPIDVVIKQEFFQDDEEQKSARRRLADEMLYDLSRPLRDAEPDNQELLSALNDIVALPSEERDELLKQTDTIAEKLVKPLAYKILELHGLDPKTADPEAAREALRAPVTPEQQVQLQAAYSKAFDDMYGQDVADTLEQAGIRVDRRDPEQVWDEFERYVKGLEEEPAEPASTSYAAIGVPAALLGAVATVAVTQVFSWIRRRQRRHRGGRSSRGSRGSSSLSVTRSGGSVSSYTDEELP
jgi:hypothetical protein